MPVLKAKAPDYEKQLGVTAAGKTWGSLKNAKENFSLVIYGMIKILPDFTKGNVSRLGFKLCEPFLTESFDNTKTVLA